jgi:hypothetical protein
MTALNGESLRRIHLQHRHRLMISKEHAEADRAVCGIALPVVQ